MDAARCQRPSRDGRREIKAVSFVAAFGSRGSEKDGRPGSFLTVARLVCRGAGFWVDMSRSFLSDELDDANMTARGLPIHQ